MSAVRAFTFYGVSCQAQLIDDVTGDVCLDTLAHLGMTLRSLHQVVELLGVKFLPTDRVFIRRNLQELIIQSSQRSFGESPILRKKRKSLWICIRLVSNQKGPPLPPPPPLCVSHQALQQPGGLRYDDEDLLHQLGDDGHLGALGALVRLEHTGSGA